MSRQPRELRFSGSRRHGPDPQSACAAAAGVTVALTRAAASRFVRTVSAMYPVPLTRPLALDWLSADSARAMRSGPTASSVSALSVSNMVAWREPSPEAVSPLSSPRHRRGPRPSTGVRTLPVLLGLVPTALSSAEMVDGAYRAIAGSDLQHHLYRPPGSARC